MKKILMVILIVIFVFTIAGCKKVDYSGEYIGYSWKGEVDGIALEDAKEKIETKMILDKKGVITDLEMNFYVLVEDKWIIRNDPKATITFNTDIEPTPASLDKENFNNGESMFSIDTNDKMSLFIAGVDEEGTVAYGIVDPITRFIFEAKFPINYDFNTKLGNLTVNNGFIPTTMTSKSALVKPENWEELSGKTILDLNLYSNVISLRGVYKDISNETTIKEFLELSGVKFVDDKPQSLAATYGYHSAGGWYGNYQNIANTLIGKNATELTGLTTFEGKNYEGDEYKISINQDNFFGINSDTVSGATTTIQKSYDTISGATVRISRENTSFQRALVKAGIIDEKDVIKGRF